MLFVNLYGHRSIPESIAALAAPEKISCSAVEMVFSICNLGPTGRAGVCFKDVNSFDSFDIVMDGK